MQEQTGHKISCFLTKQLSADYPRPAWLISNSMIKAAQPLGTLHNHFTYYLQSLFEPGVSLFISPLISFPAFLMMHIPKGL
jgi:hypothetical protein